MVQVTCEKTGLQFEAATRRTKNHPTIMGWLNEAANAGWYQQALATIKQGREQGFTTLEQFVDALRATEENHKAESTAAYAAEKERQRLLQDARRDRFTTNAFLRERGYKWHKFENDEEDIDLLGLPEVEYTLFSPDGRAVSVKQAMQELAYADVRYAKEWLAKHGIAEELPAIEQQRQAEAEQAKQVEAKIEALDQEGKVYCAEMTARLIEAGLPQSTARKEALRLAQPCDPMEAHVVLGPIWMPDGKLRMLVIDGDGRYGFADQYSLWTGLQEVLDQYPDDDALHSVLAPYVERNARPWEG